MFRTFFYSVNARGTKRADPLEWVIVTEDLTNKVIVWATEVASYAARLPSKKARDDYLRERHLEPGDGRPSGKRDAA